MDEFRKAYEYTEEKRGLILLFIIMIITIDTLQAPCYIVPVYGNLKHIPVLGICFMAISILYVLFILLTAMTCYKVKKNMVIISKTYLVVRTIFLVGCIIILFLYNVHGNNNTLIGKHYNSDIALLFTEIIGPIAFELVFSAGWYLYFTKSKRCRELVQKYTS